LHAKNAEEQKEAAQLRRWTFRSSGGATAHDDNIGDSLGGPPPRSVELTYREVEAIGDMVQSKEYRHMPIRGLALHAQRIGKVFAHPGTWAKLIRGRGWLRPRLRLHPQKPRIGFRAVAPNEAWHVDATIIKLLDGTKALPSRGRQLLSQDFGLDCCGDTQPDEHMLRAPTGCGVPE
jgi:hypothetical protein